MDNVKQPKASSSKSKSKCIKEVITKTIAMETSSDHILVLRSALRDEAGNDKDVLKDYASCAKFKKNGEDLVYEFYTVLPRNLFKFCLGLSKQQLEKSYNSCGYGWVDDEKKGELKASEARFLLIRRRTQFEITGEKESKTDEEKKQYVGYANFRFSLQGEVVNENEGEPALMLFDLQFVPEVQRKGLGKYTMMLLELIAKKQQMSHFMIPVVKHNPAAHSFFTKALKGFGLDKEYGQDETQAILSKSLIPKVIKPKSPTTTTTTSASPAPVTPPSTSNSDKSIISTDTPTPTKTTTAAPAKSPSHKISTNTDTTAAALTPDTETNAG